MPSVASTDALSPALIRDVAQEIKQAFRPTFVRLGKELRAYLGRWGVFLLTFEQVADRDSVIDALSRLPLRSARVIADATRHPDWLALETAIVVAALEHDLVEVLGLDHWLDPRVADAAAARLRAFNIRREAFSLRVSVPVLLWLKPAQQSTLATTAPDIWSWRAGVHRFVEDVAEPAIDRSARPVTFGPADIDNRTLEERRLRIDELVAYLGGEPVDAERRVVVGLRLELAALYGSIGRYDEALDVRESLRSLLEHEKDRLARASNLGGIAFILAQRGRFDEALGLLLDDVLPLYDRPGDAYSRAVTMGSVADILQMRGDLDEALKIRQEEELPVFEQLGNERAKATTLGKVADILKMRGRLDEALTIREQQLPVYERLGDVRAKALTLGRIADILEERGELDEALRIRRDDELPVYRMLGDTRSTAVTLGQIADVLQARGQLDEALAIRVDEELPVYERMGDVHSVAVTRSQIAEIYQRRGEFDEALALLQDEVLPVYERLGVVRERALAVGMIADILQARGQFDQAMAIRLHEELPVYEKVGDIRSRAFTLIRIADALVSAGRRRDALTLWTEQALPLMQQIGNPNWIRLVEERIAEAERMPDETVEDGGAVTERP